MDDNCTWRWWSYNLIEKTMHEICGLWWHTIPVALIHFALSYQKMQPKFLYGQVYGFKFINFPLLSHRDFFFLNFQIFWFLENFNFWQKCFVQKKFFDFYNRFSLVFFYFCPRFSCFWFFYNRVVFQLKNGKNKKMRQLPIFHFHREI